MANPGTVISRLIAKPTHKSVRYGTSSLRCTSWFLPLAWVRVHTTVEACFTPTNLKSVYIIPWVLA